MIVDTDAVAKISSAHALALYVRILEAGQPMAGTTLSHEEFRLKVGLSSQQLAKAMQELISLELVEAFLRDDPENGKTFVQTFIQVKQ